MTDDGNQIRGIILAEHDARIKEIVGLLKQRLTPVMQKELVDELRELKATRELLMEAGWHLPGV